MKKMKNIILPNKQEIEIVLKSTTSGCEILVSTNKFAYHRIGKWLKKKNEVSLVYEYILDSMITIQKSCKLAGLFAIKTQLKDFFKVEKIDMLY